MGDCFGGQRKSAFVDLVCYGGKYKSFYLEHQEIALRYNYGSLLYFVVAKTLLSSCLDKKMVA